MPSLALQIQQLGGLNLQVLVLLHVLQLQSQQSRATAAQIGALFRVLHLPPPANPSQHLTSLKKQGLVMQPFKGTWTATPLGLQEIGRLMVGAHLEELSVDSARLGEPKFADAPHHLLPPQLAPAQFQEGIGRFLAGHPFDRNVFYMSRYPARDLTHDPIGPAIEVCRQACAEGGLELHLASDRAVSDLLFGNVAAGMWACRYGIAIFENRVDKGVNYNATLEVGGMLVTGRRCLILKDVSVPMLPTDLVGHIFKAVDLSRLSTVTTEVVAWITNDLGLC